MSLPPSRRWVLHVSPVYRASLGPGHTHLSIFPRIESAAAGLGPSDGPRSREPASRATDESRSCRENEHQRGLIAPENLTS